MDFSEEVLVILSAFGGSGGAEPGPVAVRFLLPTFFWLMLSLIALQEWRSTRGQKDLFIFIASGIATSRELLMFAAEYGSLRGLVSFAELHKAYPPFEHAATMMSCILISFAFMNYLLANKTLCRLFVICSSLITLLIYIVIAHQWPAFLKEHPGATFGVFWGDLAFRIAACLFLGFALGMFLKAKRRGAEVQATLLLGLLFFFLDEFLMICNIAGNERHVNVYSPIRHNLHIWAVPLLLATYWGELRRRLSAAFAKAQGEKARTEAVIAGIGDGVSIQDPDHRLLYQNSVHKEYFGEKVGEQCYKALQHRESPCDGCPVTMSFRDGRIHRVERTVTTSKEVRYFEITASPLRDSAGNSLAGIEIVRDVTKRKKLEEELVKAQKLESLGVLAGGLAHDFNNLLTSIVGSVSIAKRHINPAHPAYKSLERSLAASRRATDLSHRLLTFAKGGMPIKRPVSLAEVIKEAVSFSLSGSKVKFKLLAPDEIWSVEADPGQMSQVFNNLVVNAVQAMPQGGTLTVSLSNVSIGPDANAALDTGDYVMITVKDDGTGISKDLLPKIFDPYFTTKKSGSGIGLSTVHSIITKHGGRIAVESDPGAGTAFIIHLKASRRRSAHAADQDGSVLKGSGRILVIDDEEPIRDTAKAMLEELGYEVSLAPEGREGIEIYRRAIAAGRSFDAVIMDLTIPGGMGGKEAIGELRRMDPNVRAIVSSGYSNDPVMADFEQFGFKGVISKPYAIDTLCKSLQTILPERTRWPTGSENFPF